LKMTEVVKKKLMAEEEGRPGLRKGPSQ